MTSRESPAHHTINTTAAVLVAVIAGCVIALVVALNTLGGPSTRCQGFGGQMFVGPGGETSCVSGRTFLPIEAYDKAGK